jgi:tryptophan synthase beta chain
MIEDYVQLTIDEMPKSWYNVLPDLPTPLPPMKDPETGPSRLELLPKIFTKSSLKINNSAERWIEIPDEVMDLYARIGRPRPLFRLRRLEEHLKTPARIYCKREDLAPTGSFKINTAIPQTYYAWKEGFKRVVSETGAGQTGSAFAYAASLFKLDYTVYQVRHAYHLKKDRVTYMKMMGAEVIESPSSRTQVGKRLLDQNPAHPGSIGAAIGESMEDVMNHEGSVYVAGSAENQVLLHHSIIGLETKKQLEKIGEKPDVLISCVGGGGNFGGLVLPFLKDKKSQGIRFLAAESMASPRLAKGEYRYDSREQSRITPLVKIYTLGVDTQLPTIRAEGIRGHGTSAIISLLRHAGEIETVAYPQDEIEVFDAARQLLQIEGILPAPESSYSVKAAIDEALDARKKGQSRVIVFNLSGNGFLDFQAYREVLPDL